MRPYLLVLIPLPGDCQAALSASFELVDASAPSTRAQVLRQHASRIQFVLTNGTTGLSANDIRALPRLELIGAIGAGYEHIACDAALDAGIAVVNGTGTNAACVADHAFALLLSLVRNILRSDQACRNGIWRDTLPAQPTFSSKRLGIVGLGHIGHEVATRAAGFGLEVGYHNRRPVAGTNYAYFPAVVSLATWADYLVIATPGGPHTHHLIDRAVLNALGPAGYLVNVARGSVVDTGALVDALASNSIAGAGLDVFEDEPSIPSSLTRSPKVVLTPHVAGISPDTLATATDLFIENVQRHLCRQPLLTPVPEYRAIANTPPQ
ncbi:2-hydroxyacid dehydrogenase (plasmid) [Burkholderia multivorans]|uniref:2-hydroxyacid dehydrogenase n=1 Tax=Burkholderia multivorans TaxID=87883 RepID=UPI002018EAB7|nr:2-hydroxyacid dehydrogenase [Burkholderia multivorans]MCO1459897.1 2-hydroxyacid dehydrogenase [Burkholderia multivorans]UQO21308.1 2-hydroxyacid dehydrogenase [Burkholderia multivorans]HEM7843190.1 2-hydroxyacid dehydrogenase [Burkholderia multivorans]HEM7908528.1 2-hydroxyacid dehydrogenase [Burkholderia multivorans]